MSRAGTALPKNSGNRATPPGITTSSPSTAQVSLPSYPSTACRNLTYLLALSTGYKDVVMAQNRDTAKYEFEFYSRCMMLASNFMLRHQSGSDIKDIFTYFRE